MSQSLVLFPKALQFSLLIYTHSTKILSLSEIGLFNNTGPPEHIKRGHISPIRELTYLYDNLFGLWSLPPFLVFYFLNILEDRHSKNGSLLLRIILMFAQNGLTADQSFCDGPGGRDKDAQTHQDVDDREQLSRKRNRHRRAVANG